MLRVQQRDRRARLDGEKLSLSRPTSEGSRYFSPWCRYLDLFVTVIVRPSASMDAIVSSSEWPGR